MPLVRVSMRRGKPATYRKAVLEGLYQAMRETFNVPEGDRFMILTEHEQDDFVYDPNYLGIQRSDDLVIIQITWNEGRTVEQKKALYKAIADGLATTLSLRREDVFIGLVEVKKENWSFGNGVAQYA